MDFILSFFIISTLKVATKQAFLTYDMVVNLRIFLLNTLAIRVWIYETILRVLCYNARDKSIFMAASWIIEYK